MEAIYIYDGDFATGDAGFPLIRMAAARHCLELSRKFNPARAEIIREEKGKPYFVDVPLEFSLTHSGSLWMCMFAESPCGLDLQVMRNLDYEKIACRYFHQDEVQAIMEGGQEAFFEIWVRKEAYCKMTGEGMFGESMPSVLADSGTWNGRPYRFTEIEISDDMKCAVCTEAEPDIQLRVLA
jgi:4'-phosphopantetheinyl transferase